MIVRIAGRISHQYNCPAEIEDAAQEISLKLVSAGPSILQKLPEGPSEVEAYFSVVMANAARSFFRARGAAKLGVKSTVALEDQLKELTAGVGVSQDFDKGLIWERVESLLPADRREQAIFRLYYRQGFTAREIAGIPALGLSLKGVESLILRLTRTVRERFHADPTVPAHHQRQDKRQSETGSVSKVEER